MTHFAGSEGYKANKADWLDGRWAGIEGAAAIDDDPRRGQTGVAVDRLREHRRSRSPRLPKSFKPTARCSACSRPAAR